MDSKMIISEESMGQTQNERILAHLREFGSITSLEATEEYGIKRYAKYRLEADR